MFINFELTLNICLNNKTSKSTEDSMLNFIIVFVIIKFINILNWEIL